MIILLLILLAICAASFLIEMIGYFSNSDLMVFGGMTVCAISGTLGFIVGTTTFIYEVSS